MKFRHNLAKETFKGKKKNTKRGVEDLIDYRPAWQPQQCHT